MLQELVWAAQTGCWENWYLLLQSNYRWQGDLSTVNADHMSLDIHKSCHLPQPPSDGSLLPGRRWPGTFWTTCHTATEQFTHAPWNYSVVFETSRCGSQESEENSKAKGLLSHAQSFISNQRALELLWKRAISICCCCFFLRPHCFKMIIYFPSQIIMKYIETILFPHLWRPLVVFRKGHSSLLWALLISHICPSISLTVIKEELQCAMTSWWLSLWAIHLAPAKALINFSF